MIVPRRFEDLGVLHEHALPPCAYYVSVSIPIASSPQGQGKSDRSHLLSNRWTFRYLPSIHDLIKSFWETPDTAPERFVMIRVPDT